MVNNKDKNKKNNSSNSLVFGQWRQTKTPKRYFSKCHQIVEASIPFVNNRPFNLSSNVFQLKGFSKSSHDRAKNKCNVV